MVTIPSLVGTYSARYRGSLITTKIQSLLLVPLIVQTKQQNKRADPVLNLINLADGRPFTFDQTSYDLTAALVPTLGTSVHCDIHSHFAGVRPSIQ